MNMVDKRFVRTGISFSLLEGVWGGGGGGGGRERERERERERLTNSKDQAVHVVTE